MTEPSTEIVVAAQAPRVLPPIGLRISIGDVVEFTKRDGESGTRPTKIDHFRPYEGDNGQFQAEKDRFLEIYGSEPKVIDDVFFLSDAPADVYDVRLRAWSQAGLRLVGLTNYAALPEEDFVTTAFGFDDDILYFPRNANEVRPDIRDAWQGEPIPGHLEGQDDLRIQKLGIAVEGELSFLLPNVLGVGKRVVIRTKGKRSIRNLYRGVWDQANAFGRLRGRPFRLAVRPARTRRFDPEAREYVRVDFFELVLDTPQTVGEILEEMRQFRASIQIPPSPARLALPTGEVDELVSESRIITEALDLPQVDIRAFDTDGDSEELGTAGSGTTVSGDGNSGPDELSLGSEVTATDVPPPPPQEDVIDGEADEIPLGLDEFVAAAVARGATDEQISKVAGQPLELITRVREGLSA